MILIVDDRIENIIPLQKILLLHNLESDSAQSGEEALKLILKKEYALIILDVQMPGMDGFEVAETLAGSNRTKDIPVIFLSALSKEKKYISKGYATGAVDYITKPVDPDLLILKVKTFLKLFNQTNELKATRDLLNKEIEIRKDAQENLERKVKDRTLELVEKNDELELKNNDLQQFAWVVSHDLKEPLRKIEIFVKLIRERFVNNDEQAIEYINRTLNASERMTLLITDLLEFSRLSAKARPEIVDLNKIAKEVIGDLEERISESSATITVGNLEKINGVPSQLRQVFQNLITNSIKFTDADTTPKINIASERIESKSIDAPASENGKFFRMTFTDNGIGFDEAYLDKIFVIFQRLHDRTTFEGTGIGLSIAKKIIEKHDGFITAKSKVGEGAQFIIVLPVLDAKKS